MTTRAVHITSFAMDVSLYFPDEIWLNEILPWTPLHWRGRAWALVSRRAAEIWHLVPLAAGTGRNRVPPSQLKRFVPYFTSFDDISYMKTPGWLLLVSPPNRVRNVLELSYLKNTPEQTKRGVKLLDTFSHRTIFDDPAAPEFLSYYAQLKRYETDGQYSYYVTYAHALSPKSDAYGCDLFSLLVCSFPSLCDWSLCKNLTRLTIRGNYIDPRRLGSIVSLTELNLLNGDFVASELYDSSTFAKLKRLKCITLNCMCVFSAQWLLELPDLRRLAFSPVRGPDEGVIPIRLEQVQNSLNAILSNSSLRSRVEFVANKYSDYIHHWAADWRRVRLGLYH
jgi:hypothetical protein